MNTAEQLECVGCPLCGSADYTTMYAGKDYLFSLETFRVVRCLACGLLFTNPRVREDHIGSYYYSGYLSFYDEKKAGVFQKAKNRLGHLFENSHRKVLQILRSIHAKTILEIGPGNGSLLFFLKEHGLEVVGVETDRNCVQRIQEHGIPCHCGDLNDLLGKTGAKKFDAVILCHSFEHLYHPQKTLKNIYHLLNENGVVYLTLPNSSSIEAKLFGKYWRGLDLPRHVIHYDEQAIRAVIEHAGFVSIELTHEDFPSSFVESLAFLFFKNGRMPTGLYQVLYYTWKLLSPIHHSIIASGVMRVVAKKPEYGHRL